jgi:hypothetical protein
MYVYRGPQFEKYIKEREIWSINLKSDIGIYILVLLPKMENKTRLALMSYQHDNQRMGREKVQGWASFIKSRNPF